MATWNQKGVNGLKEVMGRKFGPFGIYRRVNGGSRPFQIDHIPTGYRVIGELTNEHAVKLASKLREEAQTEPVWNDPSPWSEGDEDERKQRARLSFCRAFEAVFGYPHKAAKEPEPERTEDFTLVVGSLNDKEKDKLVTLSSDFGFDYIDEFLEQYALASVVPGICMNDGCDYSTEYEPDQDKGWCECCGTQTVKSGLMLAGLV